MTAALKHDYRSAVPGCHAPDRVDVDQECVVSFRLCQTDVTSRNVLTWVFFPGRAGPHANFVSRGQLTRLSSARAASAKKRERLLLTRSIAAIRSPGRVTLIRIVGETHAGRSTRNTTVSR